MKIMQSSTEAETNDGTPYTEYTDTYQCGECAHKWSEFWEQFDQDEENRMVG